MAQQDVRYYSTACCWKSTACAARVATDGHRLALCETALASKAKTRSK